jgi:hypothetical protein
VRSIFPAYAVYLAGQGKIERVFVGAVVVFTYVFSLEDRVRRSGCVASNCKAVSILRTRNMHVSLFGFVGFFVSTYFKGLK